MKNITKFTIDIHSTIKEAMQAINDNYKEVVFVIDRNDVLRGIITDGDIRRALLANRGFDYPAAKIMTRDYFSLDSSSDRTTALDIMKARSIRHIPIIDKNKELIGIHFLDELLGSQLKPNSAVIVAGGLGTRLRPMTEKCPKSMVLVAGRPILERLILHLVGYGIRKIYISINYMGEVIKKYFKDGNNYGCAIEYIEETSPLGTGGPLSILPKQKHPVIVMNGDLVTQINIDSLINFHNNTKLDATICAKGFQVEIPFGVINEKNNKLVELKEKPTQEHLINAGIYVFNPNVISLIPKNTEFPITNIFHLMQKKGMGTGVYVLDENWIDVGRMNELKKANGLS